MIFTAVKLLTNHTNLSQECAQQSSLKTVPNCLEICAQKTVLYGPRISCPLAVRIVRNLLRNSCQSLFRFLCQNCCMASQKSVLYDPLLAILSASNSVLYSCLEIRASSRKFALQSSTSLSQHSPNAHEEMKWGAPSYPNRLNEGS
jgi:hypothetical protein